MGPSFSYRCVNVSDALALLRGCAPAASHEPGQKPPRPEQNMHGLWCPYCYRASGMPAPGMPFPRGGAAPHPDLLLAHHSPRWLREKRMAQSSHPRERAASQLGSRGQQPPGRAVPGCFINIYIFFVARVLLPHVGAGGWCRAVPGRSRISKPGLSAAAPVLCPGVPHVGTRGPAPAAEPGRSSSSARGRLHRKAVHASFF